MCCRPGAEQKVVGLETRARVNIWQVQATGGKLVFGSSDRVRSKDWPFACHNSIGNADFEIFKMCSQSCATYVAHGVGGERSTHESTDVGEIKT